ncbi:MAG: hypothetical protein KDK59_11175 [Simkania sp.]|nr:hypothetical protein [Simkania sp.]
MNETNGLKLEDRLKNHPELHERIKSILDIAEGKNTGDDTADTVEEMAIAELQKLGLELMTKWAQEKAFREVDQCKSTRENVRPRKKKTPHGTQALES